MDIQAFSKFVDPALFILVPTLIGIGAMIKKSFISNRLIPSILMLCSCILSGLYLSSTKMIFDYQDFIYWLFSSITQGCILWLISWITYEKFLKSTLNNTNS